MKSKAEVKPETDQASDESVVKQRPCYEAMTDAQFLAECTDVVLCLTSKVAEIARTTCRLCRYEPADSRIASASLEFGMYGIMNSLGDILNNLDAVEDGENWTDPIFVELHRRFKDTPV